MDEADVNKRAAFDEQLLELVNSHGCRSYLMTRERLKVFVDEVEQAKAKKTGKTSKDHRRLHQFDTVQIDGRTMLIKNPKETDGQMLIYAPVEQFYDLIHECHLRLNHRSVLAIAKELSMCYANVTRDAIQIYCKLCEECNSKKIERAKRKEEEPPVVKQTKDLNEPPKKIIKLDMPDIPENPKEEFERRVYEILKKQSARSFTFTKERLEMVKSQLREAVAKQGKGLTSLEYRRLKFYELMYHNGKEFLIKKRSDKNQSILYFVSIEEMYDILKDIHLKLNHKKTNSMAKAISQRYANIPRCVIDILKTVCRDCLLKKVGMKVDPVVDCDDSSAQTGISSSGFGFDVSEGSIDTDDEFSTSNQAFDDDLKSPSGPLHTPGNFVSVEIKDEFADDDDFEDEEFNDPISSNELDEPGPSGQCTLKPEEPAETPTESPVVNEAAPSVTGVDWSNVVQSLDPVFEHKYRLCASGGEMVLWKAFMVEENQYLHFKCNKCPKEYITTIRIR